MVDKRTFTCQRIYATLKLYSFSILLVVLSIVTLHQKTDASGSVAIDTTMPSTIPETIVADWELQDSVAQIGYAQAIAKIIAKLPSEYAAKVESGSTKEAYTKACHMRRIARLLPYSDQIKKIIYARHYDLGGTQLGYIEDLKSDDYVSPCVDATFNLPAMSIGKNYKAGSALLLLDLANFYPSATTLLADEAGVIRDPCVSYDASKIAFAWLKDNNGYHIYELDTGTKTAVALTKDNIAAAVSDFEPCYLPNGDIVFNSSRCFSQVPRSFNIISNLYLINSKGKYLRRIGYDQGPTFYPTMMSTGRVIYSRWEYNDRNASGCFGIFSMTPDGCRQEEYFGNQTSKPEALPQAREIPGTSGKMMCIMTGHSSLYCGDLCIIDPNIAQNGISAIQAIAPKRPIAQALTDNGVPEERKLFQNPYPINKTWFLISYRIDITSKYRIFLMNIDGERELLAFDSSMSVSQPIPLVSRPKPSIPRYQADYAKTTGDLLIANAYSGMGIDTSVIKKGTIKKIRVIELEYPIYPWFGNTGSAAYICTPVARWGGSRAAKRIVGEMPVESDGSSAFIVPARKPLYFQLIDTNGCMVQSMRSWVTLQPGEKFSCIGCHEGPNATPPIVLPIAITPKPLEPFFDIQNDFLHYPKHIQPILDKNCVSCHGDSSESGLDLRGDSFWTGDLTGDADNKPACRYWTKSYYTLTDSVNGFSGTGRYVNFISIFSRAEGLPADTVGSHKSPLIAKLRNGHSDLKLSKEEMGKLCAWIDLCIPHSGYFTDDMKPADSAAYTEREQKLRGAEELYEATNIQEFIQDGGYKAYEQAIDGKGIKGGGRFLRLNIDRFKVRFSASGMKLTVQTPWEGTLVLMDMRGRRILTHTAIKNSYSVPLKAKLPGGLYIVRFTGPKIAEHRMVIPHFQ
jgi:hypothetical protein